MPFSNLKRIIYIEDDEGLAKLLQKRFERVGLSVDVAFTAEEGIEKLGKNKYDLILLDYNLPGMSGLEALNVILKHENTAPVIILTSGGDERIAVAALECGAADYAVKDSQQNYLDLLPTIMQAAYTKEVLLKENKRQKDEIAKALERAEAANQAKSNFLATMSHEIRTPLNVVTGLTAILSKTKLDEKQQNIVKTLTSNANLLLRLINDLLDLSRIEGGHVELESNNFQISSVLEDIRSMFEEQALKKKINFEITDNTHSKFFEGDSTRLQQIIMNLVSNALKFTEIGSIKLTAEVSGEEIIAEDKNCYILKITVQDTGIGIEAAKLPTIFDKFTQADETITRRYGGSGLGLSIATSLAKVMHGDIKVESKFGEGSIFTAIVKLKKSEENNVVISDEKKPANENPSPDHSNNKILLVEDYEPNIMVATMILEDIGYEVTCAENAEKAINIVSNTATPFHAILMDVQMQGMDGLQATQKIREMEKEKGFKHFIIGVTAHALAGDRERCISAGMDDYVSKPIHPEIMAKKLQKANSG